MSKFIRTHLTRIKLQPLVSIPKIISYAQEVLKFDLFSNEEKTKENNQFYLKDDLKILNFLIVNQNIFSLRYTKIETYINIVLQIQSNLLQNKSFEAIQNRMASIFNWNRFIYSYILNCLKSKKHITENTTTEELIASEYKGTLNICACDLKKSKLITIFPLSPDKNIKNKSMNLKTKKLKKKEKLLKTVKRLDNKNFKNKIESSQISSKENEEENNNVCSNMVKTNCIEKISCKRQTYDEMINDFDGITNENTIFLPVFENNSKIPVDIDIEKQITEDLRIILKDGAKELKIIYFSQTEFREIQRINNFTKNNVNLIKFNERNIEDASLKIQKTIKLNDKNNILSEFELESEEEFKLENDIIDEDKKKGVFIEKFEQNDNIDYCELLLTELKILEKNLNLLE